MAHRSSERLAELVAKKILPRYPTDSILDVGCGDGVVELHLNKSVSYKGLDISEACIYKQAPERGNVYYTSPQDIPKAMEGDGPWGTILLLDVLEHTREFIGLFRISGTNAGRIIVSLPNELFVLDRLRMLRGRELNAHSLDLINMPEGFKHQYIVNISKARELLVDAGIQMGFRLVEEVRRPLVCNGAIQQLLYNLLRLVSTDKLWSMGSIFVFEKLSNDPSEKC